MIKKNWLEQIKVPKFAETPVTRFAPSPTGYLHYGHVLHLIYLWAIARKCGARVLLRNEDHDRQRSRPEYFAAIKEDLAWLGFLPDPVVDLAQPSWFTQSEHPQVYQDALTKLEGKALAYPCYCSRRDIAARQSIRTEELYYDGHCRQRREASDAPILSTRLSVDAQFSGEFSDLFRGRVQQSPAKQCGDFSLVDAKGNFTYQLCNTVDDIEQGVNLIIRGEDILASTGRQIYLRKMLAPDASSIVYAHHPLVFEQGSAEKLSKRQKSASIASQREAGISAAEVLATALQLGGLASHELRAIGLSELLSELE